MVSVFAKPFGGCTLFPVLLILFPFDFLPLATDKAKAFVREKSVLLSRVAYVVMYTKATKRIIVLLF